ncbi:MAG: hypothetical protein ABF370_15100 [Verrucomicrobiales bacterium]|nr:hypothetical protein [Verrucomicrobiaceae bacterium]
MSTIDNSWNIISKRKTTYPISENFRTYLRTYSRESDIPDIYGDLCHFRESFPCLDPDGNETLWQTVVYPSVEMDHLKQRLTAIYAQLKIGGNLALADHLHIDRIDFGQFGNSRPFRIRVRNRFNDNYDHYYVKTADASRIYGLELEYILSPNRINYLTTKDTLIEEHIAGIPGDAFIRDYFPRPDLNRVRIAKEFVKFNLRCFIRLLGDMRTVNYVIDITPDFEEVQYRVRPIDFDYQSYAGRRNMYLSQFFEDNAPAVKLVTELLNWPTIKQYQNEERTLIASRVKLAQRRYEALLKCMAPEELAPHENLERLREELNQHHETLAFSKCTTMGQMVRTQLEVMLAEV